MIEFDKRRKRAALVDPIERIPMNSHANQTQHNVINSLTKSHKPAETKPCRVTIPIKMS